MVPVEARARNAGGRGGTALFTDAAEYAACLPGTTRLTVAQGRAFRARLTWVELGALRLLLAREETPLLAHVILPAARALFLFNARAISSDPFSCNGVELRRGDIGCFGAGGQLHRRTTGDAAWGSIALTPRALRGYGSTLAGRDITPPSGQILRCVQVDWRRLRRLHAEAIRITETRLHDLGHPQLVRALEQELIWALVTCLAGSGRLRQRELPELHSPTGADDA